MQTKNNYSVFITLFDDLSVDKILTMMLRFGYGLAPLAEHGYLLKRYNSAATVLGVSITASNTDYLKLRDSIGSYLTDSNIGFYSIVLIEGQPNLSWAAINIQDNKLVRPTVKTVKNVPYLKLLRKTPPPLPPENPQGE